MKKPFFQRIISSESRTLDDPRFPPQKKYWFKRYNYGLFSFFKWYPATREGWSITFVFFLCISLLTVLAYFYLEWLFHFVGLGLLACVVFWYLQYKHGEPQWWSERLAGKRINFGKDMEEATSQLRERGMYRTYYGGEAWFKEKHLPWTYTSIAVPANVKGRLVYGLGFSSLIYAFIRYWPFFENGEVAGFEGFMLWFIFVVGIMTVIVVFTQEKIYLDI